MPGDRITVHVNGWEGPDAGRVALAEAVQVTLTSEGHAAGEVSVTLLDDVHITEMNERYLDRDHPTDVISFALHGADEAPLGDIYIGVEQARRQALEGSLDPMEELIRLAVHGTLHVLGYDHPDGAWPEDDPMFARQEALVRMLTEGSRGA